MARNALQRGEKHGYYNHPQLDRFKYVSSDAYFPDQVRQAKIDYYLQVVYEESLERGYDFNERAFDTKTTEDLWEHSVPVTNGQLDFEYIHLAEKLEERDSIEKVDLIDSGDGRFLDLHPLFYMVNGPKAEWERG